MKRKIIIAVVIVIAVLLCFWGVNMLLTHMIDRINAVCKDQKFATAQDAIEGMEAEARANYDISLDYCPPYRLLYSFEYDGNTIALYAYSRGWYDNEEYHEYAVYILKNNDDGTLSFTGGFANFKLKEPEEKNNYYYFTNIKTSNGSKSISFLYLPEDSDKDIYVDGNKAEKQLVTIDGKTFYICYAISDRDTFFSNLVTPIKNRHSVEVR